MSEIVDFFSSVGTASWLNFSLKGFFVYLFILWAALTIWVARDVVSRTNNLSFQVIAIVLAALLNIFGLLIYLIIRPQKTLLERYYEELEQKALTETEEACPNCEFHLPLKFRYCPHCGAEARLPCVKCKKLTSQHWSTCAYCGEQLQKKSLQIKKEKGKKLTTDN